ncbi:NAD-dependent epimerase/dehydratase family protein [Candidatus Woesearchaeota archaeon]|jgi:UDP-glucose 4-epimerase|nr:NAD-dependent epimerase/dehydratase family protein [Candidatus Woesearchaeota archaeon]
MKVLVTGGAGFIGSHVVDKLIEQEHQVIVVDNLSTGKEINLQNNIKLINIDVSSSELSNVFEEHQPEIVIHLAAQINVNKSIQNPKLDAETNILGTINILEHCRKHKIKKIIYAASAAQFGNPQYLPIDENHPFQPLSPYGLSKSVVESYLKLYSRLYNLNHTILRYANVYGPRQNSDAEGGVIAIFSQQSLNNQQLSIFGDGKQTRDFIYVEDVAEATVLMLNKGNNQIYNLGSGKEISLNNLINLFKDILQKDISLNYVEARKGDIKKNYYSIEKIKNECSFLPKINLKEGLTKTINYFKNLQSHK